MSKDKREKKKKTEEAASPAAEPAVVELASGQVYEGVVVPDRAINRLGLRPGGVLPPLVLQTPYGDGRWMAGFVGEEGTHVDVDAEMLATGKRRT